jgi:RNA polymerase sporulation-specific sigma factor
MGVVLKAFPKPLTSGEEAEYVRLLKEGTQVEAKMARDVLVERNMRLVAHIAKKYQNIDEDMEDLISIGSIGLIKAINSFDAGKGRLATYACRCIDNELLMLLRNKKKTSREVSLFESIGQDKEGNEIHLLDVIEQQPYDVVERMEIANNLTTLFRLLNNCLSVRERDILIMRFGLSDRTEITQSEIGNRLGISRSYVSRIEKKALKKLRESFVKENQIVKQN